MCNLYITNIFVLTGQSVSRRILQRDTQATTLQLTPATEGHNQHGRGPTVQTSVWAVSFTSPQSKLCTHLMQPLPNSVCFTVEIKHSAGHRQDFTSGYLQPAEHTHECASLSNPYAQPRPRPYMVNSATTGGTGCAMSALPGLSILSWTVPMAFEVAMHPLWFPLPHLPRPQGPVAQPSTTRTEEVLHGDQATTLQTDHRNQRVQQTRQGDCHQPPLQQAGKKRTPLELLPICTHGPGPSSAEEG
jgi:hypothetical protein